KRAIAPAASSTSPGGCEQNHHRRQRSRHRRQGAGWVHGAAFRTAADELSEAERRRLERPIPFGFSSSERPLRLTPMYIPRTNAEERPEVLATFMREHPFATLISTGPAGELWATHLPVVYDATRGLHGTIEGHVARANRHHKLVRAAAEQEAAGAAPRESLVI